MIRGVDLSLDHFDLNEATETVSDGAWAKAGALQAPAAAAAGSLGKAFWAELETAEGSILGEEERRLFAAVFHPRLSDRRSEGERFVPPGTSTAYLKALRAQVQEEEQVRSRRKEHFFGDGFVAGAAGELFPASWTDSFEIARGGEQGSRAHVGDKRYALGGELVLRPQFLAQADLLETALEAEGAPAPIFEAFAEDGARFRAYRLGGLEVRTTTAQEGNHEVVGAVFSIAPPKAETKAEPALKAEDGDAIVKATQYIERAGLELSLSSVAVDGRPHHRSYTVLETKLGLRVVTEKLPDGTLAWEEDPLGLEERNALAKVLRFKDCRSESATIGDLRQYRESYQKRSGTNGGAQRGKRYARAAYDRACLGSAGLRVGKA
jgi:hypothetical protein